MLDYGYQVKLDAISESDGELLRSWRNDPSIHIWCRQIGLISETNQREWIRRQALDTSMVMFLIRAGTSDKPIGVCGLTSIEPLHRRAEFSLYIAKDFQGQGYGKKSLKSLLHFGFDSLNLNCVWGETFEGNPALKMFLDLGMKKEGTRRQFYFKNGKYLDCHLVSLLAEEYRSTSWL